MWEVMRKNVPNQEEWDVEKLTKEQEETEMSEGQDQEMIVDKEKEFDTVKEVGRKQIWKLF